MVLNLEAKRRSAAPTLPKGGPLIGDAKLKQLYAAMVRCRILDQHLRRLHRRSKPGYLSSVGHEAAIVGTAIDLRRRDWLIPSRKDYLADYLKGVPLGTILSQLDAVTSKPSHESAAPADHDRNAHSLVPPPASVAAQLDIAIGLALAVKAKKQGGVVVALCGSSQASTARLRQSVQLAALGRLPLIFLIESRALKSRPATMKDHAAALAALAEASGIPVIPVDRTDVVALYRVTFESIQRARRDGGPTVIEPAIWCWPGKPRAHEAGLADDPIDKMENYLTGKGLFSARWKQSVITRFKSKVEAAESASLGQRL